jgi:hypothetical protein
VALPVALGTALAASLAFHVVRARRARTRHHEAVDLVGRHSARLRATVLPYGVPAAYRLSGRYARIVISDAAVRELTGAARRRTGTRTGPRRGAAPPGPGVAEAFHSVFRRLPLARHAREQTALLLETVADDRALRRHSSAAPATAMYEMAAARTPRGAFAAGGHTVLIRLQRVLGPRPAPHPAFWGSVAAVAVAVPLLPLLVACLPVPADPLVLMGLL